MAVTHLGFFQVFSKKMWKWVRKCEFANLRTSTCNVRAGVFLAKKIVEMCVKVQMCEISHVRTPARLQNVCNVHGVAARVFFLQKIFWICVWKCGCAKFRTSAHPHACKMCATCMVWLSEFFFAKKFLEMCVKVRMCEISHVRTPARVQNVCNVHGVAARVFFCKKNFGNVCESADVRKFARPHTRTRAKCVSGCK